MKYKVEIKGTLKGHTIKMSIPVEIEPHLIAEMEAVEQAEHNGIKSIEIVSISECGGGEPSSQQMGLPFDDDTLESSEPEAPSSYTPYSQPSTDENCDASEDQQFDDESSSYTPYSKIKNQNEAISYHPKFTNGYAPYVTRRIIVDAGTKIK